MKIDEIFTRTGSSQMVGPVMMPAANNQLISCCCWRDPETESDDGCGNLNPLQRFRMWDEGKFVKIELVTFFTVNRNVLQFNRTSTNVLWIKWIRYCMREIK